MDMTTHHTVGTNFKSLVPLTVSYAIQKNIAVLLPDKNIQPIDNCKCYEIELALIEDLVLATHREGSTTENTDNLSIESLIT